MLEEGLPGEVVNQLAAAGHEVTIVRGADRAAFGLGQIIRREPAASPGERPVLWAGSDGRGDGMAIGIP
jgi:gamma-glutamyltranspeptidase/glutathione hydrolase